MGELFALLASMSFALSGVFAQRGAKTAGDNGTFISLLQTFFLCGLIVVFIFYSYGPIQITTKGVFWLILGGVLSSFLGRFYMYASVQHLGSVRSAGVKNLTPVFSVLLGVLLLGEVLTLQFCIGLLFVFSGLFMMVRQSLNKNKEESISLNKSDHVKSDKNFWLKTKMLLNNGYIFGTISALSLSLGLVVRKKALNEIPEPFFGTTVGGLVGILIYFVLAYFKDHYRTSLKMTFTQFNGFLFFSGLLMTAGQLFNFISVGYMEVSRAALLFTTQSFFAIIVTRWFVKTHDIITFNTLIAIGVMIAGSIIIIMD